MYPMLCWYNDVQKHVKCIWQNTFLHYIYIKVIHAHLLMLQLNMSIGAKWRWKYSAVTPILYFTCLKSLSCTRVLNTIRNLVTYIHSQGICFLWKKSCQGFRLPYSSTPITETGSLVYMASKKIRLLQKADCNLVTSVHVSAHVSV